MSDNVTAYCLAFPDGTNYWTDDDTDAERVIGRFKREHPEFCNAPYTMGMVAVVMPKARYKAIPADARFLPSTTGEPQ
jgi:hypothetical protein